MLFTHEYISDRIVRIRDVSYTAMYLVIGDDRTVLLDCGIGIGDVRDYIRREFDKEVDILLLTHGHLDHASGALLFDDIPIYLNEKDRDLMNLHVFDKESRITYTRSTYNHLPFDCPDFTDADVVDGLDSGNTLPLNDGDIFSLGGITLQAVYAPGHTQGMTMFLFIEDRIMLYGDGCGVGVLLIEDCCSTVEEYRKTLINLKKYDDCYDRIIRNHGTCESSKSLLDNVIEICTDILEGKDDRMPSKGPLPTDYPVFIAKATIEGTQKRLDGKEGNIIYALNKIR